ncbi:MAG: GNAT family N-acetyltransferase [Spirochaetia bacterium]|nr:GNAT family N-acetyltransferase [Spirochaetia bacterium]
MSTESDRRTNEMSASLTKVTRDLEVRIAEDQLEIERTLELRYNVFNVELNEGLPASRGTGKDRDDFDYFCDHLVVVDHARDGAIVGTYRMLRGPIALKNGGFYSANEFNMQNIMPFADRAAEIGRSCVHPEYRDGSVIGLLWKGIAGYIARYDLKYLMGCGSVHGTSAEQASLIYAYFKEKGCLVSDDLSVHPHPHFELPGFNPDFVIPDIKAAGKTLPPLIKGYIRAGSRIGGRPALDGEFGTTDFFILFDAADITSKYDARFLSKGKAD